LNDCKCYIFLPLFLFKSCYWEFNFNLEEKIELNISHSSWNIQIMFITKSWWYRCRIKNSGHLKLFDRIMIVVTSSIQTKLFFVLFSTVICSFIFVHLSIFCVWIFQLLSMLCVSVCEVEYILISIHRICDLWHLLVQLIKNT